jgi:hypothetical protein
MHKQSKHEYGHIQASASYTIVRKRWKWQLIYKLKNNRQIVVPQKNLSNPKLRTSKIGILSNA